jgi:hypothetical protein
MLGSKKSRGYCLEMICADFLAGVGLETGGSDLMLTAMVRLFNLLTEIQRNVFVDRLKKAS